MIKYLLTVFGLLLALYALREWKRSRPISFGLLVLALAGIGLVWFPEAASGLAHSIGVGRAADLVFYSYTALSFLMILNLAFIGVVVKVLVHAANRGMTRKIEGEPELPRGFWLPGKKEKRAAESASESEADSGAGPATKPAGEPGVGPVAGPATDPVAKPDDGATG